MIYANTNKININLSQPTIMNRATELKKLSDIERCCLTSRWRRTVEVFKRPRFCIELLFVIVVISVADIARLEGILGLYIIPLDYIGEDISMYGLCLA